MYSKGLRGRQEGQSQRKKGGRKQRSEKREDRVLLALTMEGGAGIRGKGQEMRAPLGLRKALHIHLRPLTS